MAPNIEICVDNLESVKAAYDSKVKRIELCSSLKDGGLTPSYGFLKYIKENFNDLIIFAMIRPRGGDFCYSLDELKIMGNDIELLKSAGADGFVFGCLRSDGSIDIESNKFLMEKANPLPCTFHRAFDLVQNIETSLEEVINLGFKRILTSGCAKTALEGLDVIKNLVKLSQERIIIMPGSGINPNNLAAILSANVQEYHCSASSKRSSSMNYRNDNVQMGSSENDIDWKVSDSKIIQQLIDIAKNF